ncbi:sugar kinase [Neptunicella sp. SCSIO 80796]|uniref:sugar kinase n=1 Tax=Neptunicella plasticusilytica TaxID=3117012 RepID=UPI003A4DE1A0
MNTICFIGECMLELREDEQGRMQQSFAGDAYNSAVYLKRTFGQQHVSFMTALGNDRISQKMRDTFISEDIATASLLLASEQQPGIYLVQTDEQGERSFLYWRSQSAARTMMQSVTQEVIDSLKHAKVLFFSGITLAVMVAEQRPLFWAMLTQLKNAGVQIVFDPNYRQRLWQSEQQTRQQYQLAFEMCDLMLPGVEDFHSLYGLNSVEQIIAFCQPFNIVELVIKDGANQVVTVLQGKKDYHNIVPVEQVIDTTSAGDAFNGVYLGARASGRDVAEAVHMAAKAAGFVIRYPGAIVPADNYQYFANSLIGEEQ